MINPFDLDITPEIASNIAKVTLFIKDQVPDDNFWMLRYNAIPGTAQHFRLKERKYSCNTSACYAGWGPQAGIEPSENCSCWEDYTIENLTGQGSLHDQIFAMLFSASHIDLRSAAIRRGAYFLTYGIPQLSLASLTNWEAPKDFEPDWEKIREFIVD